MSSIEIEVGVGEALDRCSILKLKSYNLSSEKAEVANTEYARVCNRLHQVGITLIGKQTHSELYDKLCKVNSKLWEAEDKIRKTTKTKEIAKLATRIIELNGERFKLKQEIDKMFNSLITEVKGH